MVWVSGYGLGVLSLVLAVLVGLGFRIFADEYGGILPGAAAALVTVVVVLAGRTITSPTIAEKRAHQDVPAEASDVSSDEAMLMAMAEDLLRERINEGEPIDWPAGVDAAPEAGVVTVERKEDFPADVWSEAADRWKAMSDEERQRIVEVRARLIEQSLGPDASGGPVGRIGFAGLGWACLAAVPAFFVGSRIAA